MPSTTPERAARWPGGDSEALQFLKEAGWNVGRDWNFRHPRDRMATGREADAIIYLQEEWDYGTIVRSDYPDKPEEPQPVMIRDADGTLDFS